jgi:hypothetical protein
MLGNYRVASQLVASRVVPSSVMLVMIVDAPWYVPNTVIRRDLRTPTVKEEIRRYRSQYSARLSTPKRPSSEPHEATRQQQAIAKTTTKWSVYKIPSVIVVFVDPGCKVQFTRLIPKSHKRPWTH